MSTISAPALFKGSVKTLFFPPEREGQSSLYPFEGVGIYDRARFVDLGGFDPSLQNTHWQLMDFGFRACLWGAQISATQFVRISYDGDTPPHDNTVDASYRRFYLKNLAPIFQGDHAFIPLRRFPGYFWQVGGDFFGAWDEFSQARRWIKEHEYRFKSDARAITELWENIGEATDIANLQGEDLGRKKPAPETQLLTALTAPLSSVSLSSDAVHPPDAVHPMNVSLTPLNEVPEEPPVAEPVPAGHNEA
jgi:hypothetical protein